MTALPLVSTLTSPARRAGLALLLVVFCLLPVAGAQSAPDERRKKDNVATAINEVDASHASAFAWEISKQRGGVVDHLNHAFARASCVDCGASAIAFQIVLVSGSPTTVVPQNLSEAYNVECTGCVAVAEARQFVRVLEAPTKFTDAGRAVLNDVRDTLRALEPATLTVAELHEIVEQQEARVEHVLDNELVLKSDPDVESTVVESELFQSTDAG
jgi:hypothetical protein